MKVCTKCGETKPLSEFYSRNRKKARKDGTLYEWRSSYGHCKACHYAYNRANAESGKYDAYYRQYRKENKEKIAARTRAYYERNLTEWWGIVAAHIELRCTVCGYDKSSAALDFHHIDPSQKEATIHKIMGGGTGERPNDINVARLKKELSKCIVLCANCHREHHAKYNFLEKVAPKVTEVMKR